jgi:hypothetical protein
MPSIRGGDLARRLAAESALVAVFGAIGVGGASLALPDAGGGPSLPVDVVAEAVATVASLVFALTVTAGSVIYTLWWLVAGVLALGAVVLYRAADEEHELLRRAFAAAGALALPLLLAYIYAALEGGLLAAVSETPGVGVLLLALTGIGVGGAAYYGVRAVDDVHRRVRDRFQRLSVEAVARAGVKPVAFAGLVAVSFVSLSFRRRWPPWARLSSAWRTESRTGSCRA